MTYPALIVSSLVYMLADDTKIFRLAYSDDYKAVQDDLNSLYEWLLTWQLKFNILKCKHSHLDLGLVHQFGF